MPSVLSIVMAHMVVRVVVEANSQVMRIGKFQPTVVPNPLNGYQRNSEHITTLQIQPHMHIPVAL